MNTLNRDEEYQRPSTSANGSFNPNNSAINRSNSTNQPITNDSNKLIKKKVTRKPDNAETNPAVNLLVQHAIIPEVILYRILLVLRSYNGWMNSVWFSLVYIKINHSVFKPGHYGYKSLAEVFNNTQYFYIYNNMLHKQLDLPNYKRWLDCESNWTKTKLLNLQKRIEQELTLNVSINILQKRIHNRSNNKHQVIVSEAYHPCFFFVQLLKNIESLNSLSHDMQVFYFIPRQKYIVKPEHILVGSYFAAYFINVNKWRRVKIIREVQSMVVQVIHVDCGTMDFILKKDLRYLDKKFCTLKAQAIHCCLFNFNTVNEVKAKTVNMFFNMVNNRRVLLAHFDMVNELNYMNQVAHVTLSEGCKNINRELFKFHS
ncbi:Hypothetical protein CINCED_3A021282 [Cinara cedri]|uniref:Tudor domain-containing protein n=1 Tax=Cinara cedri TaxID=506608 RepID=A0A5E4M4M0_9HEMI|nr:Hypothetical protein CINCED_3A021282 [Cinara cedri]